MHDLMHAYTVIKRLENSEAAVFTTQQLAVMLGTSVETTSVTLHRLVKKGLIKRLLRGRYCLPDESPLAVATGIHHPSFITLLAAYEYHGVSTQSPRIIDVLNPSRSRRLRVDLETGSFIMRYIKVSPELIFGFQKVYVGNKATIIARKERAMTDSVMYPEYRTIDDAVACIREGIDADLAIDFAKRTRRQAVMKRMGYLLSREGIDCEPKDFKELSPTYVPLDPLNKSRGTYDKKWRIIVNKVLE